MWRYFFVYCCSAINFAIVGLIINAVQLVLYLTVKQISGSVYKKINYYLCYVYFSSYVVGYKCVYSFFVSKRVFVFFVDWFSKTEINLYMDQKDFSEYLGKEHAFLIANHSYEIDWITMLSVSNKIRCLGNSKTFIKNDVQYVPGFGFILFLSDYICLARNYKKDKKTIEQTVKQIVAYPDPTWLILYPEGTRYTKQKHDISMQFAKEKGLPQLKHHLSPRIKGFMTSLPSMKGKVKALYDVTIAFNPNDENEPKLHNLFMGKKLRAHIYFKRIPFEEIPNNEEDISRFINNIFQQKDKLRESFYKTGDFFAESNVKRVEKIKFNNNFNILLTVIACYIFSMGLTSYYLINLLLTGRTTLFFSLITIILTIGFCMHKALGLGKISNHSKYGINNKK